MNKIMNETTQLTVSYELLLLLGWIITHEKNRLKKLINKSLKTGLTIELEKNYKKNIQADELASKLQYNVADFFNLLEQLLQDAVSESLETTASQKKLMETIDHIDAALCDTEIVRASMQEISSALDQDPTANAKDIFLKEILKQWKPSNKLVH